MLTLLFIAWLVQAPPTQPTASAPETATAVVRGRITDKESGRPLARAAVTIWLNNPSRRIESLADEDGRYQFTNLPETSFSLSATAGEYRATHPPTFFEYVDANGRRMRTITIKAGEVREGVDVAMPRALAISGRVVDEGGEPVAHVRLRLARAGSGASYLTGYPRETDDRGHFRLFGLAAGAYTVCADLDDIPVPFRAGTPRKPRLIPTCHPSASEEAAEPVVLTASDVDGLEIRIRRSATFAISGVVLGPDGGMADGASLSVTRFQRNGSSTTPVRLEADGRFAIGDLVPGRYLLRAGPAAFGSMEPQPRPDRPRAELPVLIDTEDVSGVVLAMRMPARVHGRIMFDDAVDRYAQPMTVSVEARRDDVGRTGDPWPSSVVTPELTFELGDLVGPMVVSVEGLPQGVIVGEVRYRGRDITDAPAEFRTGDDTIVISLTRRGAVVNGAVTGEDGRAAAAGRVLVFPVDPARRRLVPADSAVPIATSGRFSVSARRAGDYMILAVPSTEGLLFRDIKGFDLLSRYAERVTLLENDRREVNLRMTTIQGERK